MHTKTVYRASQALADAGLVTVRFNFRGVGTSTGSHDEGYGERDDVRNVVDWAVERHLSLPVLVGGFSFGSMVGLSWGVEDERVVGLFALGLPVGIRAYDYTYLKDAAKPLLVVQGEEDQFGSGTRVAEVARGLGSHVTLVRIAGADHYFTDRLAQMQDAVRGYYDSGPGSRLLAIA